MVVVVDVGVLGCTGSVGQRFIELLQGHPHFRLTHIGASPSSAGKPYSSFKWRLGGRAPASAGSLIVQECKPALFAGCRVVFSALDSDVAGDVETAFADAGFAVFSNAKNHRMDPLVPLIVPTANPEAISLIHEQRKHAANARGLLLANANCSTTGLVVALRPLLDAFGIEAVVVTTMQAISGAGYPGVPSLDITDNVVPYISGEEDKMETEPLKILSAQFAVSASCNRVHVIDGHTESVSVKLSKPNVTLDEFKACLRGYKNPLAQHALPSSPEHALLVLDDDDRPQPRLDRDVGNGYTVTVGRVRVCPVMGFKFTLLSHNTILGAAGSGILNAELALKQGYLLE